jgi:N-acetylmuramic acid 6-phosphate etherase
VHRVDGWGPWLGDAGSGYSIGRKALEYALAAHDGRAKPTPFTRAVLRHVGFRVPERDIAGFYARKNAQAEIASLVPLVVRAANRGDRMAKRLLDEAAESLAELARSALEKLASAPTSLLVGGGLVEAIPQLVERVQRRVRGNAKVARSELPADAACALLALEDAGHALEESERSRLVAAIGKEPARVLRAPRASRPRAPAQAEPALSSTEAQNPATERFSFQSAREMAELMNAEDRRVAPAVGAILDEVAAAIELCEKQLRAGGRLVYVGAGTSGRLGVLDASEIPPTFGEPPRTVQAVIAGGARAITHAVEGAEDRGEEGESAIRRLRIGRKDVVVGLSVSGGAAFVLHALAEARRRGASTIGITCNPRSELARSVHIALVPKVGPEVIAGSSRLKAGTAQKLLLNMLSTCTMARLGRVTGNLMTRVATTNQKLRLRATRIAAEVLGVPEREARRKLEESGWRLEAALRR